MNCFFVDGSQTNLADVILDNTVAGETCAVLSYGFGVMQVKRLMSAFDQVLLLADSSHSKLNKKAYDEVVRLSSMDNGFTFRPVRTHAKLVIIDSEIVIFTSANLSANKRIESYLIGKVSEISGIDKMLEFFGNPDEIFKKNASENSDLDLDIDINLDIGI